MKTSLNEIDALVISNIGNIDAAANRLNYEIEKRVVGAVFGIIGKWAEARSWKSGLNWEGEVWIAPPNWHLGADRISWFALEYGASDEGNNDVDDGQFSLTRFCGVGKSTIGFRWHFAVPANGRKFWKTFIRPFIEEIKKAGFEYEDGGRFYLKWRIEPELLAKAYRDNSISDAMGPLTKALDVIASSQKLFNTVVQRAKKEIKPV